MGWGEETGIGVATFESPEGPFKIVGKDGKLFADLEVGVGNYIDPFLFKMQGQNIYYVEVFMEYLA